MFGYFGHPLVWLVITVLDIIAIVSILKSSADSGTKLLWIVVVILLPLLGMVLYFLMGPGRRRVV
ncbi:MAG: PLD nuclease N-terminal domain-containing protein [Acidobacteriota bacterium]